MKRFSGPLLIVLTVMVTLNSRATAGEGCLGPSPIAGQVLALDPKTGEARLVYRVPRASLSRVAVGTGVLYVGNESELHAIQLPAGKRLWTFKAPYTVYDVRRTAQAILCGAGGNLLSVEIATGKEKWRFASQGAVCDMVLSDGMVMFCSEDGVHALDEQTGKPRWLLPGPAFSDHLSWGGHGTICTWGLKRTFVADLRTGQLVWQDESTAESPRWSGFPANIAAGDGLLFSIPTVDEANGKITIIATEVVTRQRLWQTTLDARLGKQLAVYLLGEQLLVTNQEGKDSIFALTAATGKVQWHLPAGSLIRPAASFESLIVTDGQSSVRCLDRQTGKDRWQYVPAKLPAGHSYSIRTPTVTPDAIYVTVNQLMNRGGAGRSIP